MLYERPKRYGAAARGAKRVHRPTCNGGLGRAGTRSRQAHCHRNLTRLHITTLDHAASLVIQVPDPSQTKVVASGRPLHRSTVTTGAGLHTGGSSQEARPPGFQRLGSASYTVQTGGGRPEEEAAAAMERGASLGSSTGPPTDSGSGERAGLHAAFIFAGALRLDAVSWRLGRESLPQTAQP